MIDWNMVAAIVALITIPFFAWPILSPLASLLRQHLLGFLHRQARCESINFGDLHTGRIRPSGMLQTVNSAMLALPTPRYSISSNAGLADFFKSVWSISPKRIARPQYLRADKSYLRIDAKVLTMAILLDGWSFLGGGGGDGMHVAMWDTFAFSYGNVSGRFVLRNDGAGADAYVVGKIRGFPQHQPLRPQLKGLTKKDLCLIAEGYPPFYRELFRSRSGASVVHPIEGMRDIHRAGWVVAVGFSADEPVNIYNQRHGQAYSGACDRVLKALKRLQESYRGDLARFDLIRIAIDAVAQMNNLTSGSGVFAILRNTPLSGCHSGHDIGTTLNAADVRIVLDFFNKYEEGPVSGEDRARLDPMLGDAVKAAVCGIFTWWQYVNNESSALPGWLLDDRIRQCPIWLEDQNDGHRI